MLITHTFVKVIHAFKQQYNRAIFHLMKKIVLLFLFIITLPVFAQQDIKTLKYCVDPDWMPFEGVVNGKHTGIASDYLELFSQSLPYKFILVSTNSWKESTDFLKSGKCDLTLMLNSSAEREKYLTFSLPYFFGPNVLVTKDGMPFIQDLTAIGDMTLGVVSGYRLLEEIPMYYPEIKIKVLSSEEAGLLSVNQGDIDAFVGSLYSINLSINTLNLQSVKINGWISLQDKLRIGFTKPNAHLTPIFNKAIEKISSKQHNDILMRWSDARVVKQTDYIVLYYFISGMSLLFIVFLWRYLVSIKISNALKHKNKELEQIREELLFVNKELEYLSFHDNLTNLYNRHYFMSTLKDYLNQLARQEIDSCILMVDLDFFKKINDEFGHAVGDKILQQFSALLLNALRAGDIAARWGGEEFVVLLPETDNNSSLTLAKRLIEAVEHYSFDLNINLTISIGVSQFKDNDTIESWIERADTALYQAKNEGRNCIKESA